MVTEAAATEVYTVALHDARPVWALSGGAEAGARALGQLTLAGDGRWEFALDAAAADGLAAGSVVTERFAVQGVDGAGAALSQEIVIRIEGDRKSVV